LDWSVR